MAKKLVAFLAGAALASAWWSVVVWPEHTETAPIGPRWATPIFVTVIVGLMIIATMYQHWEDKP